MALKNIPIQTKLLVVSVLLVVLSLAVLGVISLQFSEKGIFDLVESTLNEQTRSAQVLAELGFDEAKDLLDKSVDLMQNMAADEGGININTRKTYTVYATNQATGSATSITIPAMQTGDKPLYQNYHIVDEVKTILQTDVTIFQATPQGLLRISTNVISNNERAIGTYVPTDSPVYKTVMSGQTHFGQATVLGEPFLAIYAPIRDNTGRVVGALSSGFPLEDAMKAAISMVNTAEVGKTGYMYIMDSDGMLLHHPTSEGSSIIEHDFAKEIIQNKDGFIVYEWEGRDKVTSYRYFKDLDWYIVSGAYFEDYTELLGHISKAIIITIVVAALIVAGLMILLSRHINAGVLDIVAQVGSLTESVNMGELDRRGDPEESVIDFRSIITGINQVIDVFVAPINMTAEYVDRISKGDLPPKITETYHGDFNEIKNNLNACIDVISALLNETEQLIDATKMGQLDKRGDADAFTHGWRDLVQSINELVDAFVAPINMTAEYVDRISKGNMPPKITETYHGDFNEIKNNLNQCIDAINGILEESRQVSVAVNEGRLDHRADTALYEGRWRDLLNGFNEMVETFTVPLREVIDRFSQVSNGKIPDKITTDYKGDFIRIKEAVDDAIEGLSGLVKANEILQKVAANDFTDKMDSNYEGLYNEVAMAVNQVIDRLVHVQNIAVNIGEGDLSDLAGLKSQGKRSANDQIVPALIAMLEAIGGLLADARTMAEAANAGDLKTRADVKKHNGAYAELIGGINNMLDSIVTPINEAMSVMERLAAKDITARVTGNYKGEMNEFKQNVNNAADNLDDAMAQVDTAVEQISSAADQISSGSQSLAEGTSEMASSLEEIASSLEEMNSLTVGNADNAKEGASLSSQALANVQKGNEAMGSMTEAMTSISKSAEETGKIIKTIDEIAFQTNLLALNAAVEAAHAGEAGKGFAVVAEEVKNLALRSAEAAKNTSELIEGSLKNSEAGAKIVQQVTESFVEIRASFEKVNSIVNEISAASDEQALGIGEVNSAIGELNQLTQRNAANAEESASAAEELNGQSGELGGMVAEFTLSQTGHGKKKGGQNDRRQPKRLASKPKDMYEVNPQKLLPLDDVEEGDFKDF